MTRIGILGTGHLAEFLIRGAQGKGFSFTVSPRSADRAAALAAAYGVRVAASNQAVLDACDLILVALPAAQGLDILQGLRFRAGHSVLSAMAGVRLHALAQAAAPARVAVTMMPGLANTLGLGPCLLCPDAADWRGFLSVQGPLHVIQQEADFVVACVFGALSGASFVWMQALIDWFTAQGMAPDGARRLVAETLRGNAQVLLSDPAPLAALCAGVATPGGITEALLGHLHAAGAMDRWQGAMDVVLDRVRG